MPWRMATRGYNKIKEMNLLDDKDKQYVLAGHSQGGKMAAQFIYENSGVVDQLILLGTTHPRDIDLSEIPIPVLKIYGSNDGVADSEKIMANKSKLPLTTRYVRIDGGNHSQFGYYGFQPGDHKADNIKERTTKNNFRAYPGIYYATLNRSWQWGLITRFLLLYSPRGQSNNCCSTGFVINESPLTITP